MQDDFNKEQFQSHMSTYFEIREVLSGISFLEQVRPTYWVSSHFGISLIFSTTKGMISCTDNFGNYLSYEVALELLEDDQKKEFLYHINYRDYFIGVK